MGYITRVLLYSDGSCKSNPGPGSVGIVICNDDNSLLHEYSACIGYCTNNQAEYRALIKGLDLCARYTRGEVVCFCDSELIVKQLTGRYRLRDDFLRNLFHEVNRNKVPFSQVHFQNVNKANQRLQRADALAKQAQEGKCIDRSYESQAWEIQRKPSKRVQN